MKNVVKRDVAIASSGVEIQITVLTNPAIIVAMTPIPEYRFQKNVNMTAGDRVHPTPAHAQLTTRKTRDFEVKAITNPTIPAPTIVSREIATNFFSDNFKFNARLMISSLTELVITNSCESAVEIIAARIPASNMPAIQGGIKSRIMKGKIISTSANT